MPGSSPPTTPAGCCCSARLDTGQWANPMGKQEFGETVTRCAVSETQEETRIRTEVTAIFGIYSDPGHVVYYDSDGGTRKDYEVILLDREVAAGVHGAAQPGVDRHDRVGRADTRAYLVIEPRERDEF